MPVIATRVVPDLYETDVDPQLVTAGLWGAALEAYRRDPQSPEASQLVARSLVRFGMPEAAPLVLADGLGRTVTVAIQDEQLRTGHAVSCGLSVLPADFAGTVVVTAGDVPLLDAGTLTDLVDTHATATAPTPAPAATTGGFRCDGRQYCSQMHSCAEAQYFLRHCPDVKMDGDHNGAFTEQLLAAGSEAPPARVTRAAPG